MIGKIIIPVIDTESGNFDTNIKLTTEQYQEMVYDNFMKNDRAINNYMTEGRREYRGNGYVIDNSEANQIEIKYNNKECECLFLQVNKGEIDETYLDTLMDSGKMSLLLVNINPNEMDPDAQSEIRFWIDDSKRILDDNALDDMTKIKTLPKRNFEIVTNNDKRYKIDGCKLLENRSDDKFPYYFAIMIEKIS